MTKSTSEKLVQKDIEELEKNAEKLRSYKKLTEAPKLTCACGKEVSKEKLEETNKAFEKEGPIGISQWREQGKRYGYWTYFEKEIYEQGTADAGPSKLHLEAKMKEAKREVVEQMLEYQRINWSCPPDVIDDIRQSFLPKEK